MTIIPRARNTDPETSHEAADSVENIRERQQAILRVLREFGPCTDEELRVLYNGGYLLPALPKQSDSGLRTRRKELVEKGLVEFTGDMIKGSSGRRARVWRAI